MVLLCATKEFALGQLTQVPEGYDCTALCSITVMLHFASVTRHLQSGIEHPGCSN
jgi:hypothetical protein